MTPRQQFAATVRKALQEYIVRRPVSEAPHEELVIVDNGTADRWGRMRATGRLKDGRWVGENGQALTFAPTIWIEVRR